jgi:hypothetical protein
MPIQGSHKAGEFMLLGRIESVIGERLSLWIGATLNAPKKKALCTEIQSAFLFFGGTSGGRTHDKRIKSPLLYQLSYGPFASKFLLPGKP